jgi:hypothetical protein
MKTFFPFTLYSEQKRNNSNFSTNLSLYVLKSCKWDFVDGWLLGKFQFYNWGWNEGLWADNSKNKISLTVQLSKILVGHPTTKFSPRILTKLLYMWIENERKWHWKSIWVKESTIETPKSVWMRDWPQSLTLKGNRSQQTLWFWNLLNSIFYFRILNYVNISLKNCQVRVRNLPFCAVEV